jgi:N-dimethylarginine dimethylaminohydrolase
MSIEPPCRTLAEYVAELIGRLGDADPEALERMRAEGLEVIDIEYEMFTLGGGGVHCSCHELRREPG